MYRKVKRVSDRISGIFHQAPERLFLILNALVWFFCGTAGMAVLRLAAGGAVSWTNLLSVGICAGFLPGFYGGILYLYRSASF